VTPINCNTVSFCNDSNVVSENGPPNRELKRSRCTRPVRRLSDGADVIDLPAPPKSRSDKVVTRPDTHRRLPTVGQEVFDAKRGHCVALLHSISLKNDINAICCDSRSGCPKVVTMKMKMKSIFGVQLFHARRRAKERIKIKINNIDDDDECSRVSAALGPDNKSVMVVAPALELELSDLIDSVKEVDADSDVIGVSLGGSDKVREKGFVPTPRLVVPN
jgi:hypothetical protein